MTFDYFLSKVQNSKSCIGPLLEGRDLISCRVAETRQCAKKAICVIFKALLLERDIAQHERKHETEKRKKEAMLALLGDIQQLID